MVREGQRDTPQPLPLLLVAGFARRGAGRPGERGRHGLTPPVGEEDLPQPPERVVRHRGVERGQERVVRHRGVERGQAILQIGPNPGLHGDDAGLDEFLADRVGAPGRQGPGLPPDHLEPPAPRLGDLVHPAGRPRREPVHRPDQGEPGDPPQQRAHPPPEEHELEAVERQAHEDQGE